MNNVNNKLTYTEYKGSKDILTIDLHNDYTVIAIKIWNTEEQKEAARIRLQKARENKNKNK